jgi:hypothetical protein
MGNENLPDSGENSDDFEFEVHPLSWAGAGSHRWRRIAAGIAIVLVIILAFELAENGHSTSTTAQSSSPTPGRVIVTATTLALPPQPSSTPPASALQPAPSNCPGASGGGGTATLGEMTYYADPAFGSSPVWMLGLGSNPTRHVVHFIQSYPPLLYTSNGWRWRILLVSAPGYTSDLTLSGEETGGGKTAALYMDVGSGLKAKLLLNASQPFMRGLAWAEWPIYVYLPTASCYQIAAHWQGGSWSIYFAAGA